LNFKQRYNINEDKKMINNGKESNIKELKQYVNELHNEYKKFKEDFKKVQIYPVLNAF
jgi:hypothetical protein